MQEVTNEQIIKTAVLANIEYDTLGNIIMADWTKLEEFIEMRFLPAHLKMRKQKENGEVSYFPSISLNLILKQRLSVAEKIHIINYLEEQKISVYATPAVLDELERLNDNQAFEGIDYIKMHESQNKLEKLPKVLTVKENKDKLKTYKETKDVSLKEELILGNMRLAYHNVCFIAKKVGIAVEELEGYAYEGLIEAIEKFDIDNIASFSTYASVAIRRKVMIGIAELKGYKWSNFYQKFSQTKAKLEKDFCLTMEEEPGLVFQAIDDLAKEGEMSSQNIFHNRDRVLLKMPENLDKYLDSKEIDPYDSNAYIENDYTQESLAQDNLLPLEVGYDFVKKQLSLALENLSEKEQEIIRRRYYGVDNKEPETFKSIASSYNCTSSNINSIEKKSLAKLASLEVPNHLKECLELFEQYNYEPNPIMRREIEMAPKKVKQLKP